MDMDQVLEPKLVNKLTELLGILSKKDALTIFLLSKDGLKAEADTPQKIGLTRKQYYTRLKQLVDAGLIDKYDDVYLHTTLGSFIYQKHVLELISQVKNVEEMKMVDTLKRTKQFSDEKILNFVDKLTGSGLSLSASPRIEIVWTYEDMVSAIVERVEFCKSEILLATRFLNEIIINNILRKAKSGVNVKVLADVSLVKQYIQMEKQGLAMVDKHVDERANVVINPWYPGSVSRRLTKMPFSMIILDGEEVGIELIDWNEPTKFNGVIFIKEENACKALINFYEKMWNVASDDIAKVLKNSADTDITRAGSNFIEKMQK
jgi:predicted transcriptional regulator